MYTYRKPKNPKHAIQLVEYANKKVSWDICQSSDLLESQKYFDTCKPIVFIYKNNELVASAYNKPNETLTVVDLAGRDITKTYSKLLLHEINIELKQLELF